MSLGPMRLSFFPYPSTNWTKGKIVNHEVGTKHWRIWRLSGHFFN